MRRSLRGISYADVQRLFAIVAAIELPAVAHLHALFFRRLPTRARWNPNAARSEVRAGLSYSATQRRLQTLARERYLERFYLDRAHRVAGVRLLSRAFTEYRELIGHSPPVTRCRKIRSWQRGEIWSKLAALNLSCEHTRRSDALVETFLRPGDQVDRRIFDVVHRPMSHDPSCTLVLVDDPDVAVEEIVRRIPHTRSGMCLPIAVVPADDGSVWSDTCPAGVHCGDGAKGFWVHRGARFRALVSAIDATEGCRIWAPLALAGVAVPPAF